MQNINTDVWLRMWGIKLCKRRGTVSLWLSVCFKVSTIDITLNGNSGVGWESQWIQWNPSDEEREEKENFNI